MFGTAAQVPGARADVVIVISERAGRTTVLSIPRDMLVSPSFGTYERLTLTLLDGPQRLVDALCTSLGIAATHLVVVDFSAFSSIVDAAGGITVTLPAPIRDAYADLYIPHVPAGGRVHLNGTEALALVRSRMPQWEVNGRWISVPDGSLERTEWAGRVLDAVVGKVRGAETDPWTMQSVAYAATGHLTTDNQTGLLTLAGLRNVRARAIAVPAAAIANTLAVQPDAATHATLAAAGFGGRCVAPPP